MRALLALPLAAAFAAIPLDLSDLGVPYEGVGALSGGGGDTRLLLDYAPSVQADVWDALFAPNAGAALQIIKVEIGGDSQSTEGVEQSHSRFRGDLNCSRGYEWTVLAEARARNPAIRTYGLSWGAPGWIGNGSYYSQDGIDYHVSWLDCAARYWGGPLDYLGIWNEVNYDADWIVQLRRALDDAGYQSTRLVAADVGGWDVASAAASDPALAAAVDIIGSHYPGEAPSAAQVAWGQATGKPFWASEMWDLSATNDYDGAMALASDLSRFARYGLSASIVWCLIYSWYPNLNYGHASNSSNGGSGHALLSAAEPWSGNWAVQPPLAVVAHWTQFAQPGGWRFLNATGSGVGTLPGGGTYAALVNADAPAGGTEFSLVIETSAARAPTNATFQLAPRPGAALPAALTVWCTTSAEQLFQRQADAPVDARSGAFSVAVPARAICSVTSTTGQGWVRPPAAPVPPTAPFPFPYAESFEGYAAGAYARYWCDMGGVFNVVALPAGMRLAGEAAGAASAAAAAGAAAGTAAYQQVLPSSPINWLWDRTPYPYTVAGNGNPDAPAGSAVTGWRDYTVTALGGLDPALPDTLPQVLAGRQAPCPSPGAAPSGGTAYTLSGGDMAATPAYLVSVEHPGLCLGVTGQLRNMSALQADGYTVGLVNCSAAVAGEDKPVALLHDPANGRLWWNGPAHYLCLQALNGSTASGDDALSLAMLRCEGDSPGGITAWAPQPLGGGAVAFKALDGEGNCAAASPATAPPPFVFVTLRMGVTGGATLFPSGYSLVLYQSPSPAQPGAWELLYSMTRLAAGPTPTPVLPGELHALQLTAAGTNITASLGGARLVSVDDASGGWGMVAIGSSWSSAFFTSVRVE